MSKVKLTLTVEEALIINAKIVAKNSRKSLSEMIENYLMTFKPSDKEITKSSSALQLRGIAKSSLSKKSDKEIREAMYQDKYGI